MANIVIAYATRYGQTAKIANRIAERLKEAGFSTDAKCVTSDIPRAALEGADLIIVGAPVMYGKHVSEATSFVIKNLGLLNQKETAFFSVSMAAARDTPVDREEVAKHLSSFQEATGWKPGVVQSFAGALRYSKYNVFLRFVIRMISKNKGSETDTSRDYEHTDWARVDAFARELISRLDDLQPEPVLGTYPVTREGQPRTPATRTSR